MKIATGEAANSFVAIVLDQCVFIQFLPIPLTLIARRGKVLQLKCSRFILAWILEGMLSRSVWV